MTCEFYSFAGHYCGAETNDNLYCAPPTEVTEEDPEWIYLCEAHIHHFWPDGVPNDCVDPGDIDNEDEHECDGDNCCYPVEDDENPYVD